MQIGGVETAVRSSVDELNSDFDFNVITLQKNNDQFISSLEFKDKVICFNLHSIFAPINLIKLVFFVKRKSPDIVMSSLWKSHIVSILVKLIYPRITLITLIHSSSFFHVLDALFSKLVINMSTLVLCDSRSCMEFVKAKSNPKRIEILSFLLEDKKTEFVERKKINKSFNAVFLGRLAYEKRIDRSILLIELLIRRGVNASLTIYGPDHGIKSKLMTLTKDKNLPVSFYDQVQPDEVHDTIKVFDFFVQLSDLEGMAISVVQAMQNGLIPLVTKVGEMQYYVNHLQNGILVNEPFDDLESTVDLLLEILASDERLNYLRRQAHLTFDGKKNYSTHLQEILRRELES
jgi:glycosyltransferase involved in cell wall biosynthesis